MTDQKYVENNHKKALTIAAATTILLSLIYSSYAALGQQQYSINEKFSNNLGHTYNIHIGEGTEQYTKTSPEKQLNITKKQGNQTTKFTSNGKTLTKIQNENEQITRVETPHGTYTKGYENGRKIEDYQGVDKEKLKQIKSNLEEEMKKEKASLEDRRQTVIQKHLQNIKLEINKEKADNTYFELTNEGEEEINLENWRMEATESETETREAEHTFQKIKIQPEETLKVYTESDNQIKEDEKHTIAEEMTIYSTQTDTIKIYNSHRQKITQKTYNQ